MPSSKPRHVLSLHQKLTLRRWHSERPHWLVEVSDTPEFNAECIVIEVPDIVTNGFGRVNNWIIYPGGSLVPGTPSSAVEVCFWEDEVTIYASLEAALRDVANLWCKRNEDAERAGVA